MADDVLELFSQFVRLRQSGYSPNEAWHTLGEQIDTLSKRENDRLVLLLRGWEGKEGRNYKPARADPYETSVKPPPGLVEAREQIRAQAENQTRGIRRIGAEQNNGIRPISSTPAGAACPSCHKLNAVGAAYCYACGTPLSSGRRPGDTQPMPAEGDEASSYFGDGMSLYFQIRGVKQMIKLQPRADEVVLGRTSSENVMLPDVDFTTFDGERLGVSRLHATLRRHGDTVVLSDMGSLNHTYVNGQRLHPHEVRVLHNGDEVRLGQLILRVHFRKE